MASLACADVSRAQNLLVRFFLSSKLVYVYSSKMWQKGRVNHSTVISQSLNINILIEDNAAA